MPNDTALAKALIGAALIQRETGGQLPDLKALYERAKVTGFDWRTDEALVALRRVTDVVLATLTEPAVRSPRPQGPRTRKWSGG